MKHRLSLHHCQEAGSNESLPGRTQMSPPFYKVQGQEHSGQEVCQRPLPAESLLVPDTLSPAWPIRLLLFPTRKPPQRTGTLLSLLCPPRRYYSCPGLSAWAQAFVYLCQAEAISEPYIYCETWQLRAALIDGTPFWELCSHAFLPTSMCLACIGVRWGSGSTCASEKSHLPRQCVWKSSLVSLPGPLSSSSSTASHVICQLQCRLKSRDLQEGNEESVARVWFRSRQHCL